MVSRPSLLSWCSLTAGTPWQTAWSSAVSLCLNFAVRLGLSVNYIVYSQVAEHNHLYVPFNPGSCCCLWLPHWYVSTIHQSLIAPLHNSFATPQTHVCWQIRNTWGGSRSAFYLFRVFLEIHCPNESELNSRLEDDGSCQDDIPPLR
jgi:hypothetical protein